MMRNTLEDTEKRNTHTEEVIKNIQENELCLTMIKKYVRKPKIKSTDEVGNKKR